MKISSDLSLHEKCYGCERLNAMSLCSIYIEPIKQWTRIGGCASRTYNKKEVKEKVFKLNPLKASKRSMGK